MEEQKQEQKKGSMFNFILGIFFIFSFGFSLYNKGLEIINTLGFIFGLVKIYEEGYNRDSSDWKIKPIILITVIGTVLVMVILKV